MEVAEEDVLSMEENVFGNLRHVACTGPPKRPAQNVDRAGPSFVQHFGSDQYGIGSYKMFVEAAEGEVQCMERRTSRNVRPAASTGPPKRPT